MNRRITGQKVLIVDDESTNIRVLAEALKSEYAVTFATEGEKALQLAGSDSPPDLILLDIIMPGMDGYQVIEKLKKDDVTKNIPVIFITAKSADEDEVRGLELGAADYVTKPFNPAIVRQRVRTHLDLKSNRDLLERLLEERTRELQDSHREMKDRVITLRRENEEVRRRERRYMEQAIKDGLTSLYNTRYFRSQIILEIHKAESLELPLSLVMLDVDDFKQYNDTYGHQAGDKVLIGLGKVILACVREDDLACRYGGEEFAVILPGSGGEKAAEVAERIRSTFEAQRFKPGNGQSVKVTVSIGVSEHNIGDDSASLVEEADKALYRAKGEGKNRVIRADR